MAKHGIEFCKVMHFLFYFLYRNAHLFCHFLLVCFFVRHEFMQGRIEQTNGYRQVLHGFENTFKVGTLDRKQFFERFAAAFLVVGQDHFAHGLDTVTFEEHMFGTAKADPFSSEITGNL